MSKSVQPEDLNELYYGHEESHDCDDDGCKDAMHCVSTVELADNPLFNTDKVIKDALLNIYSNTNLQSGVEPNLWKISFDQLNDAVDKGFGAVKFNTPDFGFVQELKHNNGVFAAFKAYDQAKELRANLIDEKGKLKSFAQFNKDTAHITAKHKRYRKTEYNTAVKRARSAQQFKEFQKTAHLYPNIKWTPSRSAHPDAIHRGYYGTVLPINDPFWASNFPGNRYGCKCGWEVTDDEVTGEPAEKAKPVPGLDKSPVATKSIFTKTHRCRNLANGKKISTKKRKAIEQVARRLTNMEQEKRLLNWRDNYFNEHFNSRLYPNIKAIALEHFKLRYKSKNLIFNHIAFHRGYVKDIINHCQNKYDLKEFTRFLPINYKTWKYEGWAKTKPGTHNEAYCFTYYKITITNEEWYINCKVHKQHKAEIPYAITKLPNNIISGEPDNYIEIRTEMLIEFDKEKMRLEEAKP